MEFEEPFAQFRAHGLIIRGGAKMSKSRGNVIIPDPLIERHGADTFRLYLMFLGPFMAGGDYQDKGISGPRGFLHRLWETVVPREGELGDDAPDDRLEALLHRTIRKVTDDIAALHYNTAIAAMMEYLNAVRAGGREAVRAEVEPLVCLVAPFAPHIAEELWRSLGHSGGIFEGANWPAHDPAKAATRESTLAVQVNGKLRGTVVVPKGVEETAAVAAARAEEKVARHLEGREIRRVVHVADRLLNFVVG